MVCIIETACVYCSVRTASLIIIQFNLILQSPRHGSRRLVADLLQRRLGSDSAPLHVRVMMNIETLAHVCQYHSNSAHPHLHAALTRSRTYKKQCCFENRGHWEKLLQLFIILQVNFSQFIKIKF